MGESLTERRRVRDEGLRVVNHCQGDESGFSHQVDRAPEEARAKFVPAAAVIRTVQTLFGITGLTGCVGGRDKSGVKSLSSTEELRLKLLG